jgi:hypothetical protein
MRCGAQVMLNGRAAPAKRSYLEGRMNRETLLLGAALVGMCAAGAAGHVAGDGGTDDFRFWRDPAYSPHAPFLEGLVRFCSLLLPFQIMVPLALYASVEIVRAVQVPPIIYREALSTRRAGPRRAGPRIGRCSRIRAVSDRPAHMPVPCGGRRT